MKTFTFRGSTYVVKRLRRDSINANGYTAEGQVQDICPECNKPIVGNFCSKDCPTTKKLELQPPIIYRDAAHLGGPWSLAAPAVANNSLHLTFRANLKKAVAEVEKEDSNG